MRNEIPSREGVLHETPQFKPVQKSIELPKSLTPEQKNEAEKEEAAELSKIRRQMLLSEFKTALKSFNGGKDIAANDAKNIMLKSAAKVSRALGLDNGSMERSIVAMKDMFSESHNNEEMMLWLQAFMTSRDRFTGERSIDARNRKEEPGTSAIRLLEALKYSMEHPEILERSQLSDEDKKTIVSMKALADLISFQASNEAELYKKDVEMYKDPEVRHKWGQSTLYKRLSDENWDKLQKLAQKPERI